MVLIRDSSKQVQESVINSPKISENEIEKIANTRDHFRQTLVDSMSRGSREALWAAP